MIKEFIYENFDKCVRTNTEDDGTLIGMPYPYTVPCVSGMFQEMYYWDTYFTNAGLILCGKIEQAKNNVDNMLYLVNRFGFMPNGNRTFYLRSSQPPFLSLMVRDIYEAAGDKRWLKTATETLEKEYKFWTVRRSTETGLNQYNYNAEYADKEYAFSELKTRLPLEKYIPNEERRLEHFICNTESGWDLNPKWEFEAYNFVQVDLNSLLYAMEINIAYFKKKLKLEYSVFEERAEKRKKLINKLLFSNEKGIFLDYNFKKKEHGKVFSVASMYPLFTGVATKEQAKSSKENLLPVLETEHGILTCGEHLVPEVYQWDAPQGWAPSQYVTVKGLLNYGFTDDALRIAKKYILTVERNYEITGKLWEKYNVLDGSINTNNEYDMPPMLGWSAGVYLYFKKLICEGDLNAFL